MTMIPINWIKVLKPVGYLLALAALIYLTFIALVFYFFTPDHDIFKKDKFNKELWHQDVKANLLDNKNDCQRGKMTQDIIDNVLNRKLSRQDVINLLGEPVGSNSMRFQYAIGWCSYIDSNTLDIDFENDRLHKAYISNH